MNGWDLSQPPKKVLNTISQSSHRCPIIMSWVVNMLHRCQTVVLLRHNCLQLLWFCNVLWAWNQNLSPKLGPKLGCKQYHDGQEFCSNLKLSVVNSWILFSFNHCKISANKLLNFQMIFEFLTFQAFTAAETLICCRDNFVKFATFLLCISLLVVVSCADTSAGVGALRLFGSPPPRKVSLLLLLLLLLLLSGVAPPALTHYCTRQSTTPWRKSTPPPSSSSPSLLPSPFCITN